MGRVGKNIRERERRGDTVVDRKRSMESGNGTMYYGGVSILMASNNNNRALPRRGHVKKEIATKFVRYLSGRKTYPSNSSNEMKSSTPPSSLSSEPSFHFPPT